ncbi:MAG: hypothetical protein Kow0098_03190 [Ignavibacteriaceae bacterium]
MKPIPKKVASRLIPAIKKFRTVLEDARARDINESDTVLIVTDMLSDVFGYDKYSEITSEYAIRGTYCDLATRINGSLQYLIEVKSIGSELKDNFIKQAVDYAANEGIDWVILTNGIHWVVFKVTFGKPIDKERVIEFNFLELNYKRKQDLEVLFSLSKEGCTKSILDEFHSRKQVISKYFISSLILSEPVIKLLRRELRKIAPDVRIEEEQIKAVVGQDIIKREIVESEKTLDASRKINRGLKKQSRNKKDDFTNVSNNALKQQVVNTKQVDE